MSYLLVFLGAGLGGAMRHGVNVAAAHFFGIGFPWGTLTVNIVGSLLMGLMIEYLALKGEIGQHSRLLLTTGILGGFTTFPPFRSTHGHSSSATSTSSPRVTSWVPSFCPSPACSLASTS